MSAESSSVGVDEILQMQRSTFSFSLCNLTSTLWHFPARSEKWAEKKQNGGIFFCSLNEPVSSCNICFTASLCSCLLWLKSLCFPSGHTWLSNMQNALICHLHQIQVSDKSRFHSDTHKHKHTSHQLKSDVQPFCRELSGVSLQKLFLCF